MYKYLIIAVVFFLIGGAGYYYRESGVGDLVTQDIVQDKNGKGYGVSAIEVFSGMYECTATNGCRDTTRISLQQDTGADIIATIDNQEISLGRGTWGIGNDGSLVLIIQRTTISSSTPSSLIAKKISTLKLSGFSTKRGLFPGMTNPTFLRIGNEQGIQEQ